MSLGRYQLCCVYNYEANFWNSFVPIYLDMYLCSRQGATLLDIKGGSSYFIVGDSWQKDSRPPSDRMTGLKHTFRQDDRHQGHLQTG